MHKTCGININITFLGRWYLDIILYILSSCVFLVKKRMSANNHVQQAEACFSCLFGKWYDFFELINIKKECLICAWSHCLYVSVCHFFRYYLICVCVCVCVCACSRLYVSALCVCCASFPLLDMNGNCSFCWLLEAGGEPSGDSR